MNSLVIGLLAIIVIVIAAFAVYTYYPAYSTSSVATTTVSTTSSTTTIVSTRSGPFVTANDIINIFGANLTSNSTYDVNYCNAVNSSLNSNVSVCSDTNTYMMNVSGENFTGWVVQSSSFGVYNFQEILLYHDKNSTHAYNNFVGLVNASNSTLNATENGAIYSIIPNSSIFTNKIAVLKGNSLALVTAGGLEYNQTSNAGIVSTISKEI